MRSNCCSLLHDPSLHSNTLKKFYLIRDKTLFSISLPVFHGVMIDEIFVVKTGLRPVKESTPISDDWEVFADKASWTFTNENEPRLLIIQKIHNITQDPTKRNLNLIIYFYTYHNI
ncbi:hypothetical protein [Candidatus Nitrosocosmicus hydrocola]|uniref:hypothetical protein n=1 Tax=Candidatus Nitrosocosmicus hydrocola TaxID=1826872 RepID=UPI0011E5CBBC|nr:hypothetical protein [Candidatus Nitrosocosmicus hydrocola]